MGSLGEYLKKLREEKGYSLREAGRQTGIAEAYLWQLENGKRVIPRPEMLKKLAKGYGVPAENILKHAGYPVGPADEKKEAASKKGVLYRVYEKLSNEGKKELEKYMQYLQQKDSGK